MLSFGNWNINWRWYNSEIFSLHSQRSTEISEDLRTGSRRERTPGKRNSICQAGMFLGSPSSLSKIRWEWEYGVGELGVVIRDQIVLLQEDDHVLSLKWVSGMGCQVKVLGFMQAEAEWKQISSGRYTLHRQSVGHLRRRGAQKYGVISFYGLGNLMGGRIIPTILVEGQRFPGIRSLPTFWSFMVYLRTVMAPVGVSCSMLMYYSESVMRFKVYCRSSLLSSWNNGL